MADAVNEFRPVAGESTSPATSPKATRDPKRNSIVMKKRGSLPDIHAGSQFDRKGEFYDAAATEDAPRWFCPDLKFETKFATPVALDQLKGIKALANFQLIKPGNRLSVLPVSDAQFELIEKLAKDGEK